MEKPRSLDQNSSMHRYFFDVANELEAQGITRKTIVRDLGDADIPITEKYVKEVIWMHFMVSMYGKTKTSQLTTVELRDIEKKFTQHLREKYHLQSEWWSNELLAFQTLGEDGSIY